MATGGTSGWRQSRLMAGLGCANVAWVVTVTAILIQGSQASSKDISPERSDGMKPSGSGRDTNPRDHRIEETDRLNHARRECQFCGPMAEQPHRAKRPPPCTAGYQPLREFCDPGHDYCAIVATINPYTESRYCVKEYHKECYPKYCNRTRIWKMVCTCQSNYCNMDTTPDIHEAFMKLHTIHLTTTEEAITTILTKLTTKSPTIQQSDLGNNTMDATLNHNVSHTVTKYDNAHSFEDNESLEEDEKHEEINDKNKEHHHMPVPAALGGDNPNKSQVGAPVDDEEDISEGSGRGIDLSKGQRNSGDGNHKTKATTLALGAALTTGKSPSNLATSDIYKQHQIFISILTSVFNIFAIYFMQ